MVPWVNRPSHSPLVFYDSNVTRTHCQEHLAVSFDYRLTSNIQLKKVSAKMNAQFSSDAETFVIGICIVYRWSKIKVVLSINMYK